MLATGSPAARSPLGDPGRKGQRVLVRRSPTPWTHRNGFQKGLLRAATTSPRTPPITSRARRRCSPRLQSLDSDMSHFEPVRDVWIAIFEGGSTNTFISSARLNRTEGDSPNVPRRQWGLHPSPISTAPARPNTSTEPPAQARRRRCRTAYLWGVDPSRGLVVLVEVGPGRRPGVRARRSRRRPVG